MLFGSEEQKREWLPQGRQGPHLRVPAHRARRRLRPRAPRLDRDADRGRLGLHAQRPQAVGDQRRDRRRRRRHGPGPEGRRAARAASPRSSLDYDTEGVTVEHRNEFMGLRGIENSRHELEDVFVPEENLIGERGQGPQDRAHHAQHRPPGAAGDLRRRRQVGDQDRARVGERARAVGPAGRQARRRSRRRSRSSPRTAFGLEAMLDVSSRLADDKKNDIRIEAAIAKLYASEMGWQVVDELMQVRGGRGYETAESLKARGEKPVPVEQVLRDMRINRIFEGSTEIMHLLIAREAVDQHLQVAGDILERRRRPGRRRPRWRSSAGKFYAKWFPQLAVGEGRSPARSTSSARSPSTCASSSAPRASSPARPSTRWAAARPSSSRSRRLLGRIVDIGAELFAIASRGHLRRHDQARAARSAPSEALRAGRPVLQAGPPPRRRAVRRAVVQRRRRQLRGRAGRARRPLHVVRGGRRSTRRATGR